jgi:hypothetical protein
VLITLALARVVTRDLAISPNKKNCGRNPRVHCIMRKQPLPRPLNLSSSGMKNWITHVIMKWQLQVVTWKYKGENKHLKNYKQPDVFYHF